MKFSKPFLIGFGVGFFGAFVSTLSLVSRAVEIIAYPFLFPTRIALSPLSSFFAVMPGLLNILSFAITSGLIYGALFYVVSFFVRRRREQSGV